MMIGVAVVGAGHWGPHLIRNFNDHLSSHTLWVVDQAETRRKAIDERFPSVSVTADIDDALNDDRVDAVVVATPTSTHSALVKRALEANKHVLVEKPITNSLVDAAMLCKLAESATGYSWSDTCSCSIQLSAQPRITSTKESSASSSTCR